MSKKQEKDMEQEEFDSGLNENAESVMSDDNQLADETNSKLKEVEEQKEKYIRLLAEFENYKRRTAKERIDIFRVAGQDLIKDLLPAIDDMDRARSIVDNAKDMEAVKQGLQLISEKIGAILLSKGLQEIDCMGKDFDVDTMESVTEIPAPSPELKGKVVDIVQKGYTLNDKIIRYAKVVVGK